MKKNKVVTNEDILLKLCQSVSGVLTSATASQTHYSAMVQKINKTSLKPLSPPDKSVYFDTKTP